MTTRHQGEACVKSTCGCKQSHRDTVRGWARSGSTRLSSSVDTPEVRGMIDKVNYLVRRGRDDQIMRTELRSSRRPAPSNVAPPRRPRRRLGLGQDRRAVATGPARARRRLSTRSASRAARCRCIAALPKRGFTSHDARRRTPRCACRTLEAHEGRRKSISPRCKAEGVVSTSARWCQSDPVGQADAQARAEGTSRRPRARARRSKPRAATRSSSRRQTPKKAQEARTQDRSKRRRRRPKR